MEETKKRKSLRNQDMTTGDIMKKILLFALPVFLGTLFSQLYNTVDTIVVGNFVNKQALAAVGASGSIMTVFHAIMIGLNTGSGVVISQYFGAKDYKSLSRTITTLFIVASAVCIIMTFAGLALATPLLKLINMPEELMDYGKTYLTIIFIGTIFQFYYFLCSFILRAMGDSKLPMYLVIACSVINIALDLLFVCVFHWEVAGVAIATVISQAVSAIFCLIRIFKSEILDFSKENWCVDMDKVKSILAIGIPTMLASLATSAGGMVIQSFANGFETDFIAAMAAVTKLDRFAVMPVECFGTALTTFVGQNVGAGKTDRVKEGVRKVTWTIIILGVAIGVLMMFMGKVFMHMFTQDLAVITIGIICVRITAVSYWGQSLQQCYTGLLRGAGIALFPSIVMIGMLALRIPATWLLAVRTGDYRGIFYALAGANIIGGIIMVIYYKFGNWQNKNVIKLNRQPAPETEENS